MRHLATLLCATLGLLAACSTVPEYDDTGSRAVGTTGGPRIIGTSGPLSARQSKALLDRLVSEPGEAGLLQRHTAVEQAVAESPLIAGNRTQLLRDGPASFAAIFAAIRNARNNVNLEYYTFEDVTSGGETLGDLLVAKRQAGVVVNVLYDSYGSRGTPTAFLDRLKQAGVSLLVFNPLDPLDTRVPYAPNDRDHRKILIADGRTAVVGGVNLSTKYESHPPDGATAEHWRDTDIQIDGPVVAQLQRLFVDHWNAQHGPPFAEAAYFPTIPPDGTEVIRILGSTPDHAIPRYYVTLLSAIRTAEKSITISAAYFVPTHQEMEDLLGAARRGVVVRILLPDRSDWAWAISVAHSHYADLLEAGVTIYETHGIVLHTKTVTIDGVWSVLGSSNFDKRSILFNDEVDAMVLGSATAQALQQMFEEDIAKANRIDPAAWSRRPLSQKLRDLLARTWDTLL